MKRLEYIQTLNYIRSVLLQLEGFNDLPFRVRSSDAKIIESWTRRVERELDALIGYVNSVDIEPDGVDTSALLEENKKLKSNIARLKLDIAGYQLDNDAKRLKLELIADGLESLNLSENEDISEEDKKKLIKYIRQLTSTIKGEE